MSLSQLPTGKRRGTPCSPVCHRAKTERQTTYCYYYLPFKDCPHALIQFYEINLSQHFSSRRLFCFFFSNFGIYFQIFVQIHNLCHNLSYNKRNRLNPCELHKAFIIILLKNNTLTRLKLEQKGRTTSWQDTYIILLVNIKNKCRNVA